MTRKIHFIILFLIVQFSYTQQTHTLSAFVSNIKSTTEISNIEKNNNIKTKEYSLYNKSFLPDIALNFILPSYNRSISEILQPDGNYAFRESNNANSKVNLSLTQKLPFTGGQISVSNSFNRLDTFEKGDVTTSYSASWLGVSLSQPLNFFNEMKWDRQLQSVQVQYNTLEYQKVQIDIKKKSVVAFFEMLEIQNEKIINSKGLAVANTYRKVLKKLVESGRTMAYDSIDIELKFLDLQKRARFLAKAELLKAESINHFFNTKMINENDVLETPKLKMDLKEVKYYIDQYLELHNIREKSRLLGMIKNIKKLENSRFYSANLTVGAGFNNASNLYDDIFQNPNQSQNFSISLSIPLLDFGKKRIELEISHTDYEIETANLSQERGLTIERITFLYEEILDLIAGLELQDARIKLLKLKLKTMENLLYAQNILLKDFSEAENDYYGSLSERLSIIKSAYEKLIEMESITLTNIITYDN